MAERRERVRKEHDVFLGTSKAYEVEEKEEHIRTSNWSEEWVWIGFL